jgi:hypothetical protein
VAVTSNFDTEGDVVFGNAFNEWLTSTHPGEASEPPQATERLSSRP